MEGYQNSIDDPHFKISLKCCECENTHCSQCPIGTYVNEEQGCSRIVGEDLYIDYLHQTNEEQAFARLLATEEAYNECCQATIDILNLVYQCPLSKIIGASGRELKDATSHARK